MSFGYLFNFLLQQDLCFLFIPLGKWRTNFCAILLVVVLLRSDDVVVTNFTSPASLRSFSIVPLLIWSVKFSPFMHRSVFIFIILYIKFCFQFLQRSSSFCYVCQYWSSYGLVHLTFVDMYLFLQRSSLKQPNILDLDIVCMLVYIKNNLLLFK